MNNPNTTKDIQPNIKHLEKANTEHENCDNLSNDDLMMRYAAKLILKQECIECEKAFEKYKNIDFGTPEEIEQEICKIFEKHENMQQNKLNHNS